MAEVEYLTVATALEKVLAVFSPLPSEKVGLADALGRILAQSVTAKDSLPPFDNSAMDGYAFRAADVQEASDEKPTHLNVIGEVAAGAVFAGEVTAGTAVRIMTGAPIPAGATAVIPVELTDETYREANRPLPDTIGIKRAVNEGDYLRRAGGDVMAGDLVLEAGHTVRPQEIGVLASLGVAEVEVIRRPRVGILATGDELIGVKEPLRPGKIRNSNGYTQAAQISALGAEPVILGVARDTEEDVRAKLQAGLDAQVDLFISSAGVSVGVYDVVTAVLQDGGGVNFWKVRMRPGKPLAFGQYQGVPYLGLPGNPVSSAVSFERFARPAIMKMAGKTKLERPQLPVTILENIRSDGRESYIRAIVSKSEDAGYTAVTTGGQGSHMMTSLVKANALVIIPETVMEVTAGTELMAMMIDWPETVF